MDFAAPLAALIATALLLGVLWYETGRTNPAGSMGHLGDRAAAAAVVGILAGRLAAMIAAGTNPFTHPVDIAVVRSGVDTGFASLAALVVLALLARHHLRATFDGLAPAALAALAGWHVSSILRGAYLGTPSSLPWAFGQSGSTVTRHPVEIYAALALLLGAVALHLWKRRSPRPSLVGAVALIVAAGVRLGTEPIRPAFGHEVYWWYAAGVALGVAVLGWVLLRRHPASADPAG